MGDNRMYSSDSREWGFITRDEVIGGSLLVYWPITQMRFIKNPY
jgi:signal peptidase I